MNNEMKKAVSKIVSEIALAGSEAAGNEGQYLEFLGEVQKAVAEMYDSTEELYFAQLEEEEDEE